MVMIVTEQEAKSAFEARFGSAPEVTARAPGRVNIIGEHTDYNGGFVLPMAIERETRVFARRREDRILNAYAANLDRSAEANLDEPARNPDEPWMDYIAGVADQVAWGEHELRGADLLVAGDIPVGCGLSSSASLEMAALAVFEKLGAFTLKPMEAARLGQRVENEFLGLNTGIMDPFVIRRARKDHAIFLDCRSLEREHVPIELFGASFVIANTGVTRELGDSAYNERVAQCEEAVAKLNEALGRDAAQLRDFGPGDLEKAKDSLDDLLYRRARHVVTENDRTQEARLCLQSGAVETLGRLLNASDKSLATDYEVSCDELAAMTEIARSLEGCYGSRMTGAGFGGCTISLVDGDHLKEFSKRLLAQYKEKTGQTGEVIVSRPAPGVSLLEA